jgi:hypothetical protein
MTKPAPNTLYRVLTLTRKGNRERAEAALTRFIVDKFDIDPGDTLRIRNDNISLNSVNGTLTSRDGNTYFFKFHIEDNEETTIDEYYKADLLARTGYPIELPVFVSRDVGQQILIYPHVDHERLCDACRRLEYATPDKTAPIVAAQEAMDRLTAEKCIQTLSVGNRDDYAAEPILQLFYWRLVDKRPDGSTIPGGRWATFYTDKSITFPGVAVSYDQLSHLKWNINGVQYPISLADAFDKARRILAPENVTDYAACIAHGDAHNGNMWVKPCYDGGIQLSYFDPAFAGAKIPVLLSEIKATFHNILAHPDWLYDPADADAKLNMTAKIEGGTLYVHHNWKLSPLRERFLSSKQTHFWMPVLTELQNRHQLPGNWEDVMRMALFCCPTLVMNLRAGAGTARNSHTPKTSLLGLAIAVMCASASVGGNDPISNFFDTLVRTLKQNRSK